MTDQNFFANMRRRHINPVKKVKRLMDLRCSTYKYQLIPCNAVCWCFEGLEIRRQKDWTTAIVCCGVNNIWPSIRLVKCARTSRFIASARLTFASGFVTPKLIFYRFSCASIWKRVYQTMTFYRFNVCHVESFHYSGRTSLILWHNYLLFVLLL